MPKLTKMIKKVWRSRLAWGRGAVRTVLVTAVAVPAVLAGTQAALAATWVLQNPPIPAGTIASDFADVSCTTGSSCTAVGNAELTGGGAFEAVAERWDGSSWTEQSTPNATISDLSGVACPFVSTCVAVGDYAKNGKILTLAEHWNGNIWTSQKPPNPTGATRSFLIGVYCESGTKCTAAGAYYNHSGNEFTFAETLSGHTWTLQATPDPSGATTSQFNSVACTAVNSCTAVGYYLSPSFTLLAEHWDGTSWTIQPTPLPAGGSDGAFSSVACRNATACYAVGSYFDGTHEHTLAEFWNGSTWTPQTTPALASAKNSELAGVSCTTFGPCTAVGSLTKHHTELTLAEHWNGKSWNVQTTPNPTASEQNVFESVSCRSNVFCTAVGFTDNSIGNNIVLAEQAS